MSESTTRNESTAHGVGYLGVAALMTVIVGVAKVFGLVTTTWLVVFLPLIVTLGAWLVGVVILLILGLTFGRGGGR